MNIYLKHRSRIWVWFFGFSSYPDWWSRFCRSRDSTFWASWRTNRPSRISTAWSGLRTADSFASNEWMRGGHPMERKRNEVKRTQPWAKPDKALTINNKIQTERASFSPEKISGVPQKNFLCPMKEFSCATCFVVSWGYFLGNWNVLWDKWTFLGHTIYYRW